MTMDTKKRPMNAHWMWMALPLLMAGCATNREPAAKLNIKMPEVWSAASTSSASASASTDSADAPPDPAWWKGFQSAELDRLMGLAMSDSPDVKIAIERVRQAEAAVQSAGSSLFPSLGLSGSTGSRRTGSPSQPDSSISHSTNVGLNVSYEVDLWGRVSAGVRGAEASLDGSRFDLETARLTLTSGIANGYFQYIGLLERLDIARQNLALAERLMTIVEVRWRNGAASALDISRQQTTVLTQRAALRPLEAQAMQARHALAVLAGRAPEGFAVTREEVLRLAVPQPSAGLPGTLLTRRPDLARAEATLRGADANVEQARAALLPTLQLSGGGSLATNALLSLADPTRGLSLTGSLAQSLFDGGRLRSQVDNNEAQRQQALEGYRKAVLQALREVEDALVNAGRQSDQELAQTAIRDESQRSLTLAERRYRAGSDGLSDVLDAQRSFYGAQDQLAQTRLARLTAAVDLIKSLGGGWQLTKDAQP
jgi:multidrug efflux system outer membrane protein